MEKDGYVMKCAICKEEFKQKDMMSYSTGSRTHWLCWTCWKAGQGEAAGVEVERKRKAKKEARKRK